MPASGLRPRLVDVLVALVVVVVQVAGTIAFSHDEPSPWRLDAGAYLLLAVGPVALLARRWPEATLVAAAAAAAGYAATGYPRGPAGFPSVMIALVTAMLLGRRAFAWAVLVVTYQPSPHYRRCTRTRRSRSAASSVRP